MNITSLEIASQPSIWRQAVALAPDAARALPPPGVSALFFGCGTSAFVSQAAAWLREEAGAGRSDWAYASELPPGRPYEHVVAITRSGTTTEVLDALTGPLARARRVVVTGVPDALPDGVADAVISMPFADERSVVQTRFPTAFLTLLRTVLGDRPERALDDSERTLADPLPFDISQYDHFVFLGREWTVGLAHEAALKMREAAQAWSESFPALDYRHGPIAAAGPRSLVVALSTLDAGLRADVEATGATVLDPGTDPLARLVLCQRLAVAAAEARGLDPDTPRRLTRSVVLRPTVRATVTESARISEETS